MRVQSRLAQDVGRRADHAAYRGIDVGRRVVVWTREHRDDRQEDRLRVGPCEAHGSSRVSDKDAMVEGGHEVRGAYANAVDGRPPFARVLVAVLVFARVMQNGDAHRSVRKDCC